ncbi:hypothetical protein QT581_22580, partial [Xanthomonas citri pv. citri]
MDEDDVRGRGVVDEGAITRDGEGVHRVVEIAVGLGAYPQRERLVRAGACTQPRGAGFDEAFPSGVDTRGLDVPDEPGTGGLVGRWVELADDEFTAASGGGPVHEAHVVTAHVLAHARPDLAAEGEVRF